MYSASARRTNSSNLILVASSLKAEIMGVIPMPPDAIEYFLWDSYWQMQINKLNEGALESKVTCSEDDGEDE